MKGPSMNFENKTWKGILADMLPIKKRDIFRAYTEVLGSPDKMVITPSYFVMPNQKMELLGKIPNLKLFVIDGT